MILPFLARSLLCWISDRGLIYVIVPLPMRITFVPCFILFIGSEAHQVWMDSVTIEDWTIAGIMLLLSLLKKNRENVKRKAQKLL